MRKLLFVAVIALAPGAACTKSEKAAPAEHEANLPEISIADVEAGLKDGSVTVVDCNSEKTRKKIGILAGAILVDEETFTADDLPADKARKLVFYCGGPG